MSTLPNTDNDLRVARIEKNGDAYQYESFPLLGWLVQYCTETPAAITPWGAVQLSQEAEFPAYVLYNGEQVLTRDGWVSRAQFLAKLP